MSKTTAARQKSVLIITLSHQATATKMSENIFLCIAQKISIAPSKFPK